MKIGLIDVDGHNFPNLALMKIAAYHKSIGNQVSWVSIGDYDYTYISKVFTFSHDFIKGISNYGKIIKGGTGYNYNILPDYIDKLCPDYSIYPQYKEAYGFLTRGCPKKCSWCIVPEKEGDIYAYSDIEDFLSGRKIAVLMDNNVLAHIHGLKQIEKLIRLGIKVDFNQGLDAEIIAKNESIAKLLSKIKWYKPLRMACDTKSHMKYIQKATELLRKYNTRPSNYFIYILVKDIEDALIRVEFLRKLKLDPFAMPYRDFINNISPSREQRNFARWVNHKAIFATVSFNQYLKKQRLDYGNKP